MKKDILKVGFSNILVIISGIVVGFLVPDMMGVNNYGFYKIYTLYLTYIGLFNIGFVEGIYLKYGGTDYKDLNKLKFRTYTSFMYKLEILISIIILIIAIVLFQNEEQFIFILLSIMIFPKIITGYYQFISQMTSRFNELSFRNIINSILTIIVVVIYYILYKIEVISILSFKIYIISSVAIQYFITIWYIYTYREITFGNKEKITKNNICEFRDIIKLGFPLLFANLITALIFAMDRQFVSMLFDTYTYGIYAFAYNIIGLATTAISAISTVLYPKLKKDLKNDIIFNKYDEYIKYTAILVVFMLCGYFVLIPIINYFLPNYIMSIKIIKIIFPGLVIQSIITIVMHNYYKAVQKSKIVFLQSIGILILSIIANYIAYILFRTQYAISIASIIVLIIWLFITQHYLTKNYKVKWKKNTCYILLMISMFYLSTLIKNIYISFITYFLIFALITYIFYFCTLFKNNKKTKNI